MTAVSCDKYRFGFICPHAKTPTASKSPISECVSMVVRWLKLRMIPTRLGFGLVFLGALEHRWVGDKRVKSNHYLPITFQFLPKFSRCTLKEKHALF